MLTYRPMAGKYMKLSAGFRATRISRIETVTDMASEGSVAESEWRRSSILMRRPALLAYLFKANYRSQCISSCMSTTALRLLSLYIPTPSYVIDAAGGQYDEGSREGRRTRRGFRRMNMHVVWNNKARYTTERGVGWFVRCQV